MCPICAIGVVAGLGLSRWLNIDDAAFGIWVGALIFALSWWTFIWLFRKREKRPWPWFLLILAGYVVLTIWPLYQFGVITPECLRIFGINRFIFGTGLGLVVAGLGVWLDRFLRRFQKEGRVFFPFQKVILPLAILFLASLILNIICQNI